MTALFSPTDTLWLATRHGKERVIGPLLHEAFGLEVRVPTDFDTDRFGTFSGEVERPDTQPNTAKLKAQAFLDQRPYAEVVVVSEGSFNPHPEVPFVPLNIELVLLIDRRRGWEVLGQHATTATNVGTETIRKPADLEAYARRVGFPQQGLILRADGPHGPIIEKELTTEAALLARATALLGHGPLRAETDMRAHRNPKRLRAIGEATQDLIRQLQSRCPICTTPGYRPVAVRRGLPCALCGLPTRLPLAQTRRCAACHHAEEDLYPEGLRVADARYCDTCNP